MTNKLIDLITSGNPVILDGGMGTLIMDLHIDEDANGMPINITHPEKIQEIHRAYIEAGSQIILTNTFGGNTIRSKAHGHQEVFRNNKMAAENARKEAVKADHQVFVAGSMGPTGSLLSPLGLLSYEDAVEAFSDQVKGLLAGGVDLFWIETMSDLNEVKAAVESIRSKSDLPIAATMTFDTKGHTMMGLHPKKAVEELSNFDLIALGTNCGNGPDEMEKIIKIMADARGTTPLIIKSNAGLPILENGLINYDGTPEIMGSHAKKVRTLGATLIGGCCGTTPAHIKAMADALKN